MLSEVHLSLTDVKYMTAAAGVQPQWGITGRTILALKLLDILVETGFVRHVCARELEDPLSAQGML
jgi:hypothetical protein